MPILWTIQSINFKSAPSRMTGNLEFQGRANDYAIHRITSSVEIWKFHLQTNCVHPVTHFLLRAFSSSTHFFFAWFYCINSWGIWNVTHFRQWEQNITYRQKTIPDHHWQKPNKLIPEAKPVIMLNISETGFECKQIPLDTLLYLVLTKVCVTVSCNKRYR